MVCTDKGVEGEGRVMAMLSRRWRGDSPVNSRKEIGQAIGLLLFLSCFKIVVAVIIDLSTGYGYNQLEFWGYKLAT